MPQRSVQARRQRNSQQWYVEMGKATMEIWKEIGKPKATHLTRERALQLEEELTEILTIRFRRVDRD